MANRNNARVSSRTTGLLMKIIGDTEADSQKSHPLHLYEQKYSQMFAKCNTGAFNNCNIKGAIYDTQPH